MKKQKRLIFDFETRSMCDLKTRGAFLYSKHPTTQVTCLSFKEKGEKKTYLLRFETVQKKWADLPDAFRSLWVSYIERGFQFAAHNAYFETCIYKNLLVTRLGWPDIPFRQFRCTAAKAAACALPRSLEGGGDALALLTQKDRTGHLAVMATCKPTKQYNAWIKAVNDVKAGKRVQQVKQNLAKKPAPPVFLEYAHNPATWEHLYKYCKIDVQAEEALDDALPDLIPEEQELWFLNQWLNWRGIRLDSSIAEKVVRIMTRESTKKLKELDNITMGLVTKPGARKAILDFLALEGVALSDIRAKTIEDVLKTGEDAKGKKLSDDMKRLLEIRQALSKTSTKKFQVMLDRSDRSDDRARDVLLFHGASTGRDTGIGVQFHNLPRPLVDDFTIENVFQMLEQTPLDDEKLSALTEWLHFLYGDNLGAVFVSLLRGCLIPTKGSELFVADFSKIEVAVLWWLADNAPGVQALKDGKDPYIYQAAANLGVSYDEIGKDSPERQLGKAQVLGCFAGETMVFTNNGLTPLVYVYPSDHVWDGNGYVKHRGVVYQGIKETILFHGVRATPDHSVLTPNGWVPFLQYAVEFENPTWKGRDERRKALLATTKKLPVYDILDAGENHRFTILTEVGVLTVHNCGFGMAADKFKDTANDMYRVKLTEAQSIMAVKNYREANPGVPQMWRAVERAAISAVKGRGQKFKACRCSFFLQGKFLFIELPSGRRLAYLNPRITWRQREYTKKEIHPITGEVVKTKAMSEPKETLEFYGLAKCKKKMQLERTWGGTLTENIVQAAARDLMMPAMLRLKKAGYKPLLSVHDEGICECELGKGDLKEFIKILCKMPAWGDANLVIDAKGWQGLRYRK